MVFITQKSIPLLEALQLFSPESSKNTLKKWVKSKRVLVDSSIVEDFQVMVKQGAKISLSPKKEYFKANIEILYEDQDLVVIYKPSGLLSVATDKESYYTAHDLLKTRSQKRKIYPVHRLDKDTSGVMIFAYSSHAKEALKKQFMEHSIYREYHAFVLGHLSEKKGTWKSHLIEDVAYYMHEWDETRGKPPAEAMLAITEYEVLKEASKCYALQGPSPCSYVKFMLKTGKKNQIRVQAAHRGHPVLGDKKYSSLDSTFPRLSLHAYALEFVHPSSQKKLHFSYPYPKELYKLFTGKNAF